MDFWGIATDSKVRKLRGSYLNSGFLAGQGKRSSMPCRFFRMITILGDFQSHGLKHHLVTPRFITPDLNFSLSSKIGICWLNISICL